MSKDPTYDPETKIINAYLDSFVPDPLGLGHAFYTQMKRNRKHIAQINMDTGEKETFESMLKRSVRVAMEMRNRGVEPGNIISICSVNSMHNFIPFIAAQMVGAVVASFDPTIPLVDTEHLIKQVSPKLIFVSPDSEQLIEDALNHTGITSEIIVIGESNKHAQFQEFLEEKDDENEFQPYKVESLTDTAVILFSSGTTGLSKGICVHHYGLALQAHGFLCTTSNMVNTVGYASTYWISTVILVCVNQIFSVTRCFTAKFNPNEWWQQVESNKVGYIFMAPSQAMAIIKLGRPEGINTCSLLDVMIGGGPLSAENTRAFADLLPGTYVYQIFGQSEAAGLVTSFRSTERKDILLCHKSPSSCGRPMLGIKYKIVDPETEEVLGPNQRGELRYFSKCQMNGYYNRDSSDAFDENGWIKSGDIAYYDDDFCFFIVDRIKEMLKFQGFHVVPAKLEGILLTHSAVTAAVVIGIPDEVDGDHPMGLVVIRPGSKVTPEELVKFVNDKVDNRNKLRAGVKFITSVPYTPSGKIKKQQLKKMVLAGEI